MALAINYTPNPRKALKTQISHKNLKIMKSKRNYINPAVVEVTAEALKRFAKNHPKCKTPMATLAATEPESERPRYVRAAQRLHWNVVRTQKKVYENGVLVWEK